MIPDGLIFSRFAGAPPPISLDPNAPLFGRALAEQNDGGLFGPSWRAAASGQASLFPCAFGRPDGGLLPSIWGANFDARPTTTSVALANGVASGLEPLAQPVEDDSASFGGVPSDLLTSSNSDSTNTPSLAGASVNAPGDTAVSTGEMIGGSAAFAQPAAPPARTPWDYWSPQGCANCHGYTPATLPFYPGTAPLPSNSSFRSNGAGGPPPSRSNGNGRKQCDFQDRNDRAICSSQPDAQSRAICNKSATDRYAYCQSTGEVGHPSLDTYRRLQGYPPRRPRGGS